MHDAVAGSDLIRFFFFFHDPLNFMMGWRDIFSQHMHDALMGCVAKYRHLIMHKRTHSCRLLDRHVNARRQRSGALGRTKTLKAFYILGDSVSMTKCAPSHTVLQIEPWFPLASYTQLPITPHMSDLIASASTHMHTHMCSEAHTHTHTHIHTPVNAAHRHTYIWRQSYTLLHTNTLEAVSLPLTSNMLLQCMWVCGRLRVERSGVT